jgi:tetratricopeptide (TPR) repeat protein
MSFDRETALKSAEKAIRQGRVDAAIAEYMRIVEAQPRDWNSANALGDLYVKSKQVDKGIEQYTRIADHLAAEGFLPKAAALYKKILKFKPDQEYALLQSAEIAAKQGLMADAKTAFAAVAERRRKRGDAKGAAETTIRIGQLDPDDLDARLAGAKAALEIKDSATALSEFREVAFQLDKRGDAKQALPRSISIRRTGKFASGCSTRTCKAAISRGRGTSPPMRRR